MLRVVFDTVVFVRSLLNPHNFCGRTLFQSFAQYQLIVSRPIVVEILEVLRRPELTTRFRSLEGLDLRRVIDMLGQAEAVEVSVVAEVARDPNDDKFLATALAARADYLVSEDQDLLVLKEYQGVQIVTCESFLRILAELPRT